MQPEQPTTGELTTIIDPASITRMASSRPDGKETTLYGRHRKDGGKPRKPKKLKTKPVKPKRPIEMTIVDTMLTVCTIYVFGMLAFFWMTPLFDGDDGLATRIILSTMVVVSAVSADIPSWVYFEHMSKNDSMLD